MFSLHAKSYITFLVAKLSDQISVRIDPEWRETLRSIEVNHRIPAPDFIRGLVDAGLAFYRENGWFAFPVVVSPKSTYVDAVAETQSIYGSRAQGGGALGSASATPPPATPGG